MEDTQKSEADLLATGNTLAFQRLYQRMVNPLYRYLRKNISSHEDCEEILQDVFTDLWNRREQLSEVRSLDAYLYQSVRYKIIRYIQHRGVVKRYEDHYRFFESLYESPQVEQEENNLQVRILEKIELLPHHLQQVIQLRLKEELSNGEIAERLQITKRSVETYLNQAFRYLRMHGRDLRV